MSTETLSQVGEFGFLKRILPTLPQNQAVTVGPGDDCATFLISGQASVSTDVLVESVHFKTQWSTAQEIGRKAVAVNVADLEASGAKPVAMVIGLSAPGNTSVEWLKDLLQGIVAEANRAHISLVGGDTTSSRDITICVTVIGETGSTPPVLRSGARNGDVVAICGNVGWANLGLQALLQNANLDQELLKYQKVPQPPYGQGSIAAQSGATAMIDISDGLISDARHICDSSNVGMDFSTANWRLPEEFVKACLHLGLDPWRIVFTGGEDHALLATFPSIAFVPNNWQIIGTVNNSRQLTVNSKPWVGTGGWDHYQQ